MVDGLSSEIALIRIFTRRLAEAANKENDLDTLITALSLIGFSAGKVANLLKVQKLLGGGKDNEVAAAIAEALRELSKDLSL